MERRADPIYNPVNELWEDGAAAARNAEQGERVNTPDVSAGANLVRDDRCRRYQEGLLQPQAPRGGGGGLLTSGISSGAPAAFLDVNYAGCT